MSRLLCAFVSLQALMIAFALAPGVVVADRSTRAHVGPTGLRSERPTRTRHLTKRSSLRAQRPGLLRLGSARLATLRRAGLVSASPGFDWAALEPVDATRFALAIEVVRETFAAHRYDPRVQDRYWLARNRESGVASTGLCAPAAEALYHLLGGKQIDGERTGLVPQMYKTTNETNGVQESHWWIVYRGDSDRPGQFVRLDPTADQFEDETPAYERARGSGFQRPGGGPSNKAQVLLRAAIARLRSMGFHGPDPVDGHNASWNWLSPAAATQNSAAVSAWLSSGLPSRN